MKENDITEIAFKNSKFLESPEARTLRISSEYLEPLARLNEWKVNSTILFFGSSKADPEKKDSFLTKKIKLTKRVRKKAR